MGYIVDLENKIQQLESENALLKKNKLLKKYMTLIIREEGIDYLSKERIERNDIDITDDELKVLEDIASKI